MKTFKTLKRFQANVLAVVICSALYFLLLAPNAMAQQSDYFTMPESTYNKFYAPVRIGTFVPSHKVVFHSQTVNKDFWFDFEGDTLKAVGELHPDSAATLFIKYLIENYSGRMKNLKDTVAMLRRKQLSK